MVPENIGAAPVREIPAPLPDPGIPDVRLAAAVLARTKPAAATPHSIVITARCAPHPWRTGSFATTRFSPR